MAVITPLAPQTGRATPTRAARRFVRAARCAACRRGRWRAGCGAGGAQCAGRSASRWRCPAASTRWSCSTRCTRWPRISSSACRRCTSTIICRRNAGRWAEFCAAACAARGVPLTISRVDVARASGAESRSRRSGSALRKTAGRDADIVALAHHADDQAETVLLQLLRGAGPARTGRDAALSAPATPPVPALLRPLLALPRATLAAYANARGPRLDRRREQRRPAAQTQLAAARRGAAVGRGVSRLSVGACTRGGPPGRGFGPARRARRPGCRRRAGGLDRATLAGLSPARARNLLRWFLRGEGLRPPSTARLAAMLAQLQTAGADARTRIVHDGAEIGCPPRTHRRPCGDPDPFARAWRGESSVELPGGDLAVRTDARRRHRGGEIRGCRVTLRSRSGGERIQLAANRPRRAVKKLLYDAQLPIWRRQALPFIWCGDELAAVPGIGVALAFQAGRDEPAWRVDGVRREPRRRCAVDPSDRLTRLRGRVSRPPGDRRD